MFMQIAIGAIGIGIVLMVGYLVLSQVKGNVAVSGLQAYTNPCYNQPLNSATYCSNNTAPCYLNPNINTTATVTCLDHEVNVSMAATQATAFAGFGLLAVGVIVLAAFGIINVFQ
jgi:hypothetical protein